MPKERNHGRRHAAGFSGVNQLPINRLRRKADNMAISASYDLVTPPGSPVRSYSLPDDVFKLLNMSDSDGEMRPPTNDDMEIGSDDEIDPSINDRMETDLDDEIRNDITLNDKETCILTMIAERKFVTLAPNNVPYKIKNLILQGHSINGINVKPFNHQKFMVTLENLVQTIFSPNDLQTVLDILHNKLKIKLYCGNSEQMRLLFQNNLVKSLLPEDVPIVMYDDLVGVLVQLNALLEGEIVMRRMYM